MTLVAALPVYAQEESLYDTPLFIGPAHDTPPPHFDLEHVRLDLRIVPKEGRLIGTETLRLTPLRDSLLSLTLFSSGLAVTDISLLSDSLERPLTFQSAGGDSLVISLDTLYDANAALEIRIGYEAAPRRGLYFYNPASTSVTGQTVIWTSGAPESQRFWMPFFPPSGDRITADINITVPKPLVAFAPGVLRDTIPKPEGAIRYHFVQDNLFPLQHLNIVAGSFDQVSENILMPSGEHLAWRRAASADRMDDAARTFAHVPGMVRFFSKRLRTPYPWPTYTLVSARNLFHAHADAPGLSIVDDSVLLDRRAAKEDHPETLLAEVVATQWFTGLSGPWTDQWLHDALSAYLGLLYSTRDDQDLLDMELERARNCYLDEANQYRRPLVWDRWNEPGDLIDAHDRDKGTWVLHQIRHVIGDGAFWRAVGRYLRDDNAESVATERFRRSIEVETGRRFNRYFDQWVYAAGHPELDVSYDYNPLTENLKVTIKQTQEGYLVPEVFDLHFALEVGTLAGRSRFEVHTTRREQTFHFQVRMQPQYLLVDADNVMLSEVHNRQSVSAWVSELRRASRPVQRVGAAEALAAFNDDPDLPLGLRGAIPMEANAEVRTAILNTLATLQPSASTKRLFLTMLTDPASIVRVAAVKALGQYSDDAALEKSLRERANSDPNYSVQAAAVLALARINAPGVFELVQSALITPSHDEIIRRSALASLSILDVPAAEGLDIVKRYTGANQPTSVRIAAVQYLQTLVPRLRRARSLMRSILGVPSPPIRREAIKAMGMTGVQSDIQLLKRRLTDEPSPVLIRAIQHAIAQIRERIQP